MSRPLSPRDYEHGKRHGGLFEFNAAALGIAEQSPPTPFISNTLEAQISAAETNLNDTQAIIKHLCEFTERMFGMAGVGIEPVQPNPIEITGQLSRLYFLQYELGIQLGTIRNILNRISDGV
jgi:hypothetical protein